MSAAPPTRASTQVVVGARFIAPAAWAPLDAGAARQRSRDGQGGRDESRPYRDDPAGSSACGRLKSLQRPREVRLRGLGPRLHPSPLCHPEGAAATIFAPRSTPWRRMKDLLSGRARPRPRSGPERADSRSFAPRHGPGRAEGCVRRVAQDDREVSAPLCAGAARRTPVVVGARFIAPTLTYPRPVSRAPGTQRRPRGGRDESRPYRDGPAGSSACGRLKSLQRPREVRLRGLGPRLHPSPLRHPEGAAATICASRSTAWRRLKDLLSGRARPQRRAGSQRADSRSFAPRHGLGPAEGCVRRAAQDDREVPARRGSREGEGGRDESRPYTVDQERG